MVPEGAPLGSVAPQALYQADWKSGLTAGKEHELGRLSAGMLGERWPSDPTSLILAPVNFPRPATRLRRRSKA
jgi:hypothetical protein